MEFTNQSFPLIYIQPHRLRKRARQLHVSYLLILIQACDLWAIFQHAWKQAQIIDIFHCLLVLILPLLHSFALWPVLSLMPSSTHTSYLFFSWFLTPSASSFQAFLNISLMHYLVCIERQHVFIPLCEAATLLQISLYFNLMYLVDLP